MLGGNAALPIGFYGGLETSSDSDMQTAIGLRLSPKIAAASGADVYAVAGAQRQWWDGGTDNVFTIGVQGRKNTASGNWYGAEATYNNWRVNPESTGGPFGGPGVSGTPTSNVIGLGALFGHPFEDSPISVFGSASLLLFSDFMLDGSAWDDGGPGFQVNLGVEFTPGSN